MNRTVTAWHEKVMIPTYGIGQPEKNPIFLEKRVYQGSSGAVYPHPVVEKIYDEKFDKEYDAIFIENEYLKIMILPELGGRVHRAFDKVRNRDFVYYNQVIKPALVGLTGPWISGGIEFNWPQHHRPSTFEPIDCTIEENEDGSKTAWVNEVEQMFRTKGMAGFTLYPAKAYLEIKVRFYNRTPYPQTFLWWANPAVKVNDYYQSVFPPDVHAVYDHGKRDVSDFPIATGTYYKVNYAPGTDISMYKNIPVPTSYMAVQSKYNFIGCYEHDTKSGMLHVANHHVSTGKKQWTWGNGDFGKAWDRNLTDEDGPYIELMCGAFTDNQPDFSWIQPNEEKSFEEYFMPYAEIGMVKNASKEAALNVEFNGNEVAIKVYATAAYDNAVVQLYQNDLLIKEFVTDLSPRKIYDHTIHIPDSFFAAELKVVVKNSNQKTLVSWQPESPINTEIPPAAKAAKKPKEIESTELLYLNGLHLEQYRHATFSPVAYYQEALNRDSGDIRNNNAMGLLLLRKGKLQSAETYFRKAIQRMSERNPNPYDGEPYYNLGLCLKMQARLDEAYDYFYKATWNDAWQHSAFFQLARIACAKNNYADALYLIDKSIIKNYHSHTARHLKVAVLRKLGNLDSALALIQDSLSIDAFNYGCLFEQYLIAENKNDTVKSNERLSAFTKIIRNSFNNYLEYAIDYIHAGMYEEALGLLMIYKKATNLETPLPNYYIAWLYLKMELVESADAYLNIAANVSPDYCFPNKTEDVMVLEQAVKNNSSDAKAYYYLGNYWYANREYSDAIGYWEKSIQLDNSFATVHRNLSLACYNKLNQIEKSKALLERAFDLDHSDARVLMELDQLYKIQNHSPHQRLTLLETHLLLVEQRDDLYLERITIYNQLGNYEKAKELIAARQFHPWEGGEGKVVYQFILCHLELAKKALAEGRNEYALQLLTAAETYPHNLGEGKLFGAQENDICYLQGCAYEAMGLSEKALNKFADATSGVSEPVQAIFYNDPQPDKIFYQGLAWLKLGEATKAHGIFNKLIHFGNQHLYDTIEIDYFAVSLPDLLVFDQDLNVKNTIHCNYLIGLGMLGLGKMEAAKNSFTKVLEANINHQGAAVHQQMIIFLAQMDIIN
jgi:tetratricopeptide (TPR) repeat protein